MIGFMSTQVYGQSFGIRGGINLANMVFEENNETISDEFTSKLGFHIGGIMEIPISEILSVETGLVIDTKGFNLDMGDIVASWNLIYLDIPFTAKGAYNISDRIKVFGQAGPYIGIGLTGQVKSSWEQSGGFKIEWGTESPGDKIKRLDYGATFGVGVEFGGFQTGFSYDLGIANISPYSDKGNSIKNKILRFSVGFMFGL